MSTFVIQPLPAGDVDTEHATARRQSAEGREPCRRCLRNTDVGDPLILASYDPFLVRSAYAGERPVFVRFGRGARSPCPMIVVKGVHRWEEHVDG